jgi:hypothetical protein
MKYLVTGPLSAHHCGPLKLTPEQLARRRGLVLPAPQAGFVLPDPELPWQFKAGETIETLHPMPEGFETLARPAN